MCVASRVSAFVCLCLYLSIAWPGWGQGFHEVKFRVVQGLIVVPVTINGAGPFDFILDTGNTEAVIDKSLAEELHLHGAGEAVLETASKKAVVSVVRADSLSLGGATVPDLMFAVVNHYFGILPKVRGTLGEGFLRHFNLLIDNRRHLLQFETGPGVLTEMVTGEHLPIMLNGSGKREPNRNQLIVVGHFFESGDKDVKLQVDSGVTSIVLFTSINMSTEISGGQSVYSMGGILGGSLAQEERASRLQLGSKVYRDLRIFVPKAAPQGMDIDGVLPTSLFSAIFISHSGEFVILEPSAKPAPWNQNPAKKLCTDAKE